MEYVSRPQAMASLIAGAFVLSVVAILGLFFMPGSAYAAAPTMTSSTVTADTNTDGTIDRITVFFSEASDLDDTSGAADGFTSLAFNNGCTIVNGDYTGNGVTSKAFTVTGCTSQDTSITPTAGYTAVANCSTNFSICDDADTNQMANGANRVAADGAGPVLISASPTNLQSGVRDSASLTLTFSETVTTFNASVTGSVPLTAGIASAVVTVSHSARFLAGSNTFTISSAPDAAANAFAGAQTGDSTVASPLIFYVTSGSGDEESETSETTYSVNLLTPEDGDSFESGSMTDITWESDGGQASYVNLYLSEDGGSTWETIVTNTLNDGTYTWTTPYVDSDDMMVKVVTTDLAEELATDTSSAFSVWYLSDDEESTDEDASEDAEDSEDMPEEIDGVMAGDYIMVEGGSTIYYVDDSMMRRPFYDEATYFTYEDDFDGVVEVSADTLSEFTIGAPMLPKAGVVLVKIQSVAAVYMVEESEDGSYWLRWITSEDVAEEMFGSSWNSYVVDVDATLFTRYDMGEDVEEAEDVDTDMMKYRVDLHD
jgi:hypothetical protein